MPGHTGMEARDWDERHADPERRYSGGPSEVLVAEMSALPPGFALDLACGQGRHAVWLATHGWHVTAVDFSAVALDKGRELARQDGVACEWVAADLMEYAPVPEAYDLVVISYLHLPGAERRQILANAGAGSRARWHPVAHRARPLEPRARLRRPQQPRGAVRPGRRRRRAVAPSNRAGGHAHTSCADPGGRSHRARPPRPGPATYFPSMTSVALMRTVTLSPSAS